MRRRRPRGLSPAAYGIVVLALAACGSPAAPATDTVTVLAAASLTEAFDQLSGDFTADHPGVTVELSYGSSATLVQQVNHGAPADVLALAGESAADPLDRSAVRSSTPFAGNVLEIAVPSTNPAHVTGLGDLGRAGLKVVLCAPAVPCGRAADATFAKAGIIPSAVSREVDVKATLSKVRLGEADAAVVYHSDVVAAGDAVTGVPIPEAVNTRLRYPIITLTGDPSAQAFVDYVVGERGQHTLRSFGFTSP